MDEKKRWGRRRGEPVIERWRGAGRRRNGAKSALRATFAGRGAVAAIGALPGIIIPMTQTKNEEKRFLIINADDFGMTAQVNAAVRGAHQEGILTSASLMVAEPGFAEAVEIAQENPALGVGLHVVTTFDRALLPHSELPDITTPDGNFLKNPLAAGLRYNRSKAAQDQLKREMTAQFERFAATGLEWSHADGHQHFHLHPFVWDTFLDHCDQFGVHRLRTPYEEVRAHFRAGGDGPNINTLGTLFLRAQRRRCLRRLVERKTLGGKPVFLCDRVYGTMQSSHMTEAYWLRLLDRLQGRVIEIYAHPGTDYAVKLPVSQQTETVRDTELRGLLSPEVRAKITSLHLPMGRYADAEEFLHRG